MVLFDVNCIQIFGYGWLLFIMLYIECQICAGMDGTGLGLTLHHKALGKYVVLFIFQ